MVTFFIIFLMDIEGYSQALYSNWFYYRTDRLLLDAGDGLCTALKSRIFGIDRVLLSHGHIDHIGGLHSLINIRSAEVNSNKPLTIYYPSKDKDIRRIKRYLRNSNYNIFFPLDWVALSPGEEIELTRGRKTGLIQTFETYHKPYVATLGYRVVEVRNKLKPEYAHFPQEEIKKLQEATQPHYHTILAYGGDGAPLEPEDVERADVLIHESTFLKDEDKDYEIHSTAREALEVAMEAEVKKLIMFHFSSRYKLEEVKKGIKSLIDQMGPKFPVAVVWEDRIIDITPQG